MEGVAGVVLPEHTVPGHREYERFRRQMTAEANAAIAGAIAAGAESIVVNDAHGPMTNILIEELDSRAELISGRPKPLSMMQGISAETDAAFFVGYHGMSGSGASILEHTWHPGILDVQINGTPVGECGVNAALAGHFGVPVLLVTGDDAIAQEARGLLDGVETVSVKKGFGRTAARCLPSKVATDQISEAAERALSLSSEPLSVETPVTVSLRFQRATGADMACLVPDTRRVDGRRVEWTGTTMLDAFNVFQIMASLSRG